MSLQKDQRGRRKLAGAATWLANIVVVLAAFFVAITVRNLADDNRRLTEAVAARSSGTRSAATIKAGDTFPAVTFLDLEGSASSLRSEADTGVVVIGFLTTTCPYCRETLPAWAALSERLEDRGSAFRGVSLHDARRTLDYIAAERIDWEMRLRPNDPAEFQRLGVASVPQTIAIGADGVVIGAWRGALQLDDIDDILAVVDDELAR